MQEEQAAIRERQGGAYLTHRGILFYPFDARPEDIDIRDIIHALSHTCRFAGHTRELYTVCQHSNLVSAILQREGYGLETQLWGLLHDASEAYLLDVPTPIKQMPEFAFYREAEEKLMRVVAEAFELEWPCPESVKDADRRLLHAEARQLLKFVPQWADDDQSYQQDIFVSNPEQARNSFLGRYRSIQAAIRRRGARG